MSLFSTFHPSFTENKSYPKYIQLHDQLAQFIREHEIPAGEQLPNILVMCKQAGLSNRSVERAYLLLIEEGLCFRRPKKGTFVNACARGGATGRKRLCGIWNSADVNSLSRDIILGQIYSGLQREAAQRGIDLLILSEHTIEGYVHNPEFDFLGIVILSCYDHREAERLLKLHPQVKFFFLNYYMPGFEDLPENAYGIFNDDFAGGFTAGDYLASRHCQQLCSISLKLSDCNYARRVSGFQEAAKLNGLSDSHVHEYCWSHGAPLNQEHHLEIGRSLLEQALSDCPELDGVFCTNDLLASGVSAYLDSQNLRSRIEVVGYDNILPYLSMHGRFSTVSIRLDKIGARAIQLLDSPVPTHYPRISNIVPELMPRHCK